MKLDGDDAHWNVNRLNPTNYFFVILMVNSCSLALVKVRLMSCLWSTSETPYFRISNQLFLISLIGAVNAMQDAVVLANCLRDLKSSSKPISLHVLTISTHRDTLMSKSNMKEARWMQSWPMAMWVTASERRSLEESFAFLFLTDRLSPLHPYRPCMKDSPLFDLQLGTKVDPEAEHGKGFAVSCSFHCRNLEERLCALLRSHASRDWSIKQDLSWFSVKLYLPDIGERPLTPDGWHNRDNGQYSVYMRSSWLKQK